MTATYTTQVSTWAKAGIAMGIVSKIIPFHNETNRVVYLSWISDKNAQQTHKSNVNMNAGADGAGFGYGRERQRKDVHTGELMICPGDTSTIEMPTSTIFVTISSESGSYTTMPPCIFIDRPFSAQNCKGYTIREHKFASFGIGAAPPMPKYGVNAVPRGMHPQIMGGQQQVQPVQPMFPGQNHGIGPLMPPMFPPGGNYIPRGMHPQIMGGQQQAPTMFPGQDYGMGGQQQVQRRLEPRPGPMQKMFPGQAAGSGIGQQQRVQTMPLGQPAGYSIGQQQLVQAMPRGQAAGLPGQIQNLQNFGQHEAQSKFVKGMCTLCNKQVFNDQPREKNQHGAYVHAQCYSGI